MMKQVYFVGNWKMNLSLKDAESLCLALKKDCQADAAKQVVLAPTFLHLPFVLDWLKDSPMGFATQNCAAYLKGAYTGEVSPLLASELGVGYGIVGHSERRQLFGETNETVACKAQLLLDCNIQPIVCVGETEQQRQKNEQKVVIAEQIQTVFRALDPAKWNRVLIAYEPVWAIGTGKTATSAQVQEIHSFIEQLVLNLAEKAAVSPFSVVVLYGGSVKPANAAELIALKNVNGFLVGGASLDATSFLAIINNSCAQLHS